MVRVSMLSMAHVHADGYARQVKDHPEAELVSIWDDDAERGRAAAERFGVPYVADLEALLSDATIDGVALDSETSKHTDLILAACRHKKNLFTEKALTITTADADRVVKAVNESGIKFMISLPSRTHPEVLYMKRVLDEGLLGKPTFMRARVAHSAALDRWFKGGSLWFGDQKLAGGGALFDLGCHTVDVMRWFMGEPKTVTSRVSNVSGNYDIDDNSVMLIEFKNGALGVLDVSWVHRAGLNLTEIYGTEGGLVRGLPGQRVTYSSTRVKPQDLGAWITPTQLPPELPSPMKQWIAAIAHNEPMAITVEDGRNLTELLEACYTSSKDGRAVQLG